MADTTFSAGTVITSDWLNDVNDATYNGTAVFENSGTGATKRNTQDKLRDIPASPSDYTTLAQALANTNGVKLPAGIHTVSAALTPTTKTTIQGSGRESTFIRTSSGSADVFTATGQFITYQDFTVDRSSGVGGIGINHTGVDNNNPLEGFKLNSVNINGHTTGLRLRDFVLADITNCYIQSCATGIDINNTGSNANTMLGIRQSWIRAHTTVGLTATSVVNAHLDQVAFEASGATAPLGLAVSGGGSWMFNQSWWEGLQQCATFTNVSNVDFYGGYIDGSNLTTGAFNFNGASTSFTVTFDGPWFYQNMSGKTFAVADVGVTIYVRSPQLASLTFSAVNGGKVIYDYDLVAATTYNPGNLASNATETTTVTVTGASAGDLVEVFFDNATTDPRLFAITGVVTASDTVGVMFRNLHSADVNLASGTLTVKVRKKPLVS